MKQIVLKHKGYSWEKGSLFTVVCPDHGDTEVCRPMLFPAHWEFEGFQYTLKMPSNTGSRLYANALNEIGVINESCKHWNVAFDSVKFKVNQLKRGFSLKSSEGYLATFRLTNLDRIKCSYSKTKQAPLPLLIYLCVHLRLTLG